MFPVVVVVSLLFSGVDRKLHARMQQRVGPPLIQPFYDMVKLIHKERIVPLTSSPSIFVSATVMAATMALLGASIALTNVFTGTSFMGDIILILYLLVITSILMMIGGSSSGNPFAAVGFSRKMTLLIGYEVPLLISVILVSAKTGFSLSYHSIISQQVQMGALLAASSPSMAVSALIFMLCIPASVGVVPFDLSEAKTEIAHGSFIEYGGLYLALLKMAKDITSFTMSFLGLTLFFYLPAVIQGHVALNPWSTIGVCIAGSMVVAFLTITLPRTVSARAKLGQALKFYMAIWGLSLVAVALTLAGL